LNVEYVLTVV